MLDQATQPLILHDCTNHRLLDGRIVTAEGRVKMFGNGNISQSLMRAKGVVITNICLRNMIEVAQAETEEMIQAFAFEAADPRPSCLNPLLLAKVQSK